MTSCLSFHHRAARRIGKAVHVFLLAVIIVVAQFAGLSVPAAQAVSSWNPTLLVNTEAFQVIDDMNSTSNVSIKFGNTLNKNLTYDRTNGRFNFDAGLFVQGALNVTGSMSGNKLYVHSSFSGAGLTSCSNGTNDKLLWNSATQRFSCGADQGGGGGGLTQAQIDGLFVNQSGDTMTGGLLIQSGNPAGTIDGGLLFEVKGASSGASIHAQSILTSSGTLKVVGDVQIDGSTFYANTTQNRVGVGTLSPETTLEVVGTASGDILHANNQLRSSGSLVVEGAGSFQGALTFGDALGDAITVNSATWTFANDTNFAISGGVNGLSFDTTTLSVDATNHRIGIGTAAPKTLLEVKGTASGDTLHAQAMLNSSGATVLDGTFTLSPSATQSITAVSNTIAANSAMVKLDPNADYTMTSTPTIANGILGQQIIITADNTETNKVILQDQDTLGSSNLQLGSTVREITANKMLTLLFDGTDWVETGYTTESADIRTYTVAGANTWTKPTGAKAVYVVCVGGGGGGGGGVGGAAATARIGGGGGGGGAKAEKWLLPADLGATETATVGASGTVGTAGSSGAGGNGGAGGNSTFGTYLTCYGGGGGKGGVAAAISGGGSGGGTAGAGVVGTTATNIGGSPGATAGANGIAGQGGGGNIAAAAGNAEYGGGGGNGSSATPGAAGAGGSSIYGAAGGGGGGGITTGNASTAAGAGGTVGSYTNGASGGGGAGTGGASCTVGGAGTSGNSTKMGTAGGGGGSNTAGTACNGGAGGAYGGGGGGGGGGTTVGGAGGLGGLGVVRVYTFF